MLIIIPVDAKCELGEGDGTGSKDFMSNTLPHLAANTLAASSAGPP